MSLLSQHRVMYTVKRVAVKAGLWWRAVFEIAYDGDCVIYTSENREVADSVCEAMNTAHRVGFYDGISTAQLAENFGVKD